MLKYGAESLERAESGEARPSERFWIRKIILVGTSNGGSMRILREVHRGRKYLPLVGRTMQPEVLFSFPAVFQDLPAHIDEPFVDTQGKAIDLPLFEPDTWVQRLWSVFQPEAQARMAKRPDLFGDREQQIAYLRRALRRAQRLHRLLATDVPHFGDTRYYSLQNGYEPSPHLAVVGDQPSELWFTGDKTLKDRPYLSSLISRPGDGHAHRRQPKRSVPPRARRLYLAPVSRARRTFRADLGAEFPASLVGLPRPALSLPSLRRRSPMDDPA